MNAASSGGSSATTSSVVDPGASSAVYSSCRLRVRFDEGRMQRWSAGGPSDHNTTGFIRNHHRFVQRMRNAKILRIQPEIYQAGAPVFEFYVGGFDYDRYTESEEATG